MNKFSFFLALLCLPVDLDAQEAYINTDFNSGIPSNFIQYDNDGNTPAAAMQAIGFAVGKGWIGYQPDDEETPLVCSTSWYTNKGTSDDWLITPQFTVNNEDDVLRWRARASNSRHRDGYAVYVSTTGGSNISNFDKANPIFEVDGESYSWTSHSVSLKQFVGKTVRIAFVNNSTYQTSLYLDDLFAGQPSSIYLSMMLPDIIDKAGEYTVSGEAYTEDATPVDGFDVSFTYNGETITEHFDSVVTAGHRVPFTLKQPITLANCTRQNYTARISHGDKSYELTNPFTVLAHKSLAEEGTGTWCANCVRGIVYMEQLKEQYADQIIPISVHCDGGHTGAEPMAIPEYEEAMEALGINAFPMMVFNRDKNLSQIDPSNCLTKAAAIIKTAHPQSGLIVNGVYNSASGKVDITADTYFPVDADTMDYRLSFVFIENDVHHPEDANYAQNNATYSGGDYGEMGGWENLPTTVSASEMYYQDVARSYGEAIDGSVPSTVKAMMPNRYSCTVDLPSTVDNANKVELVAMLVNKDNVVVNAEKCALTIANSIQGVSETGKSVRLSAADGTLSVISEGQTINSIEVFSPTGNKVATIAPNSKSASVNVASLHGVYLVKVDCGNKTIVRKIVIK